MRTDGKLFLYKKGKLIVHARPPISVSNIKSIKYQEIIPYATAIIQAKFEKFTPLEKENNYVIKAHSAFADNKTILKCYLTPINKYILHNNVLPLIIINKSDNKVHIHRDITTDKFGVISNDSYCINEITLTARQ